MNIKIKLLILWCALLCFGCSDDNDNGGGGDFITVSESEITVSELGGIHNIKLSVSGAWHVNIPEGVNITVDPENGAGGNNINIRIQAGQMEANEPKSVEITFTLISSGKTQKVKVNRGTIQPGRQLDSLALVALYRATGGEKWLESWDLKKPMEEWSTSLKNQVTLAPIDGDLRVTELFIQYNGLEGSLPEELKYLDKLVNFSVQGNNLTGAFPEFLLEIPTLEMINVGENAFFGNIPSELFDMPNMKYIVLFKNQFDGQLPENIGNCKEMTYFRVDSNNFDGVIPPSLSQLVNLVNLEMAGCRFHGPVPSLSGMKKLKYLNLSNNGTFKDELYTYPDGDSESYFAYVEGGLEGELVFEDMPELKRVYLYKNHFTVCPKFKNCPSVDMFIISNNPIQHLDPSVFNIAGLEMVRAHDCELKDLPEITNSPKLKYLLLQRNEIESLPTSISKLTAMEEVLMYGNHLKSIPAEIGNWSIVRHLRFSDNQITTLPQEIWSLTSLYSIYFAGNELAGDILPESFAGMTHLQDVNFNKNQITSPVSSLVTIYNALAIQFEGNQLSGNFPDGFGLCRRLEMLNLEGNNVTGIIQPDLGNCNNLRYLYLANNQLTGQVPATLVKHRNWSTWNAPVTILPQQNGQSLTLPN